MKRTIQIRTILLLMGSFTFAFLLGEMVHEWGHFLAHHYFDHPGISIHLDPFGGSRILGVGSMPHHEMGITTAAGPGLNLIAGIFFTALLLKSSQPAFLPLVLWGPVALIQEGVNASMGLLSPGSDAQWLVHWGISEVVMIILGTLFILVGTGLISWILSRIAEIRKMSFTGRLFLVFFGLGFLMILRALISSFQSPQAALENSIPLIFALILAVIIAGAQKVSRFLVREQSARMPSWGTSIHALGLGLGMLLFQSIHP